MRFISLFSFIFLSLSLLAADPSLKKRKSSRLTTSYLIKAPEQNTKKTKREFSNYEEDPKKLVLVVIDKIKKLENLIWNDLPVQDQLPHTLMLFLVYSVLSGEDDNIYMQKQPSYRAHFIELKKELLTRHSQQIKELYRIFAKIRQQERQGDKLLSSENILIANYALNTLVKFFDAYYIADILHSECNGNISLNPERKAEMEYNFIEEINREFPRKASSLTPKKLKKIKGQLSCLVPNKNGNFMKLPLTNAGRGIFAHYTKKYRAQGANGVKQYCVADAYKSKYLIMRHTTYLLTSKSDKNYIDRKSVEVHIGRGLAIPHTWAPSYVPALLSNLAKLDETKNLIATGNLTILDTSCGYGGGFIGAAASCKVAKWIGIDPNPNLYSLYGEFARDYLAQVGLKKPHFTFDFYNAEAENFNFEQNIGAGNVTLLITSPPYGDCEKYVYDDESEAKQSRKYVGKARGSNLNSWVDKFLIPMIRNALAVMQPGGVISLNVSNYNKNSWVDYFAGEMDRVLSKELKKLPSMIYQFRTGQEPLLNYLVLAPDAFKHFDKADLEGAESEEEVEMESGYVCHAGIPNTPLDGSDISSSAKDASEVLNLNFDLNTPFDESWLNFDGQEDPFGELNQNFDELGDPLAKPDQTFDEFANSLDEPSQIFDEFGNFVVQPDLNFGS